MEDNKRMKRYKFAIPTSAVLNNSLNGLDLSLLYWIKYFEYKQDSKNRCMINATNTWFALHNDINGIDLRFRNLFNTSIKKLEYHGYIKIIHVESGNTFIVNIINPNVEEKESFIFVENFDIYSILFCDKDANKYSLFRYFCFLLSTFRSKTTLGNDIWNKCPVGFITIEQLALLTGFCKDTVYNYNKILEELKLIHVFRTNDTFKSEDKESGEVKEEHISNTYGRHRNTDLINEVATRHIQIYGLIYNKKHSKNASVPIANQGRSLTMTYRWFCQNPNKYSTDEIRELYLGLLDYNKKKKKDNRKDLTVFKGYSFYKEEEHEEDNDVDVKSDLLERRCD